MKFWCLFYVCNSHSLLVFMFLFLLIHPQQVFCRHWEGAMAKLLSEFRSTFFLVRLLLPIPTHLRGLVQYEQLCSIQISQQQERPVSSDATKARRSARERFSDRCQRATSHAHSIHTSRRSAKCYTDKQWHHRLQSRQVLIRRMLPEQESHSTTLEQNSTLPT